MKYLAATKVVFTSKATNTKGMEMLEENLYAFLSAGTTQSPEKKAELVAIMKEAMVNCWSDALP